MDPVQSAMQTITHALDTSHAEKERWEQEKKSLLVRIEQLEKEAVRHEATEVNMARRIQMLELALQHRAGKPDGPEPRRVTFAGEAAVMPEVETSPAETDSQTSPLLFGSGGETGVLQEEWKEWAEVVSLRCHLDRATTVAFHPTSPLLCSGSQDATLKLWNLTNLARGPVDNEMEVRFTLRGHTAAVNMCQFWMDGRAIMSCSDDHTIRFWDIPAPDENLYQAYGRSVLHHQKTLTGHRAAVLAAIPIPGSNHVISSSADHTVRLWGGDASSAFEMPTDQESVPTTVSVCTALSSCVVGYNTGELVLVDLEKMKQSRVIPADPGQRGAVYSVTSHQNLPLCIAAHDDGSIVCYDLRTGSAAHVLTSTHLGAVRSLDIDSTGLLLASGGDDCKVKLWDIGRWKVLEEHRSHVGGGARAGVLNTTFHLEKRLLASAGADGIVRVYQGE